MLDVKCKEYLEEVKSAAAEMGPEWTEKLEKQLDYLDSFNDRERTRCELQKDFAPLSFYFVMFAKNRIGEEEVWFNGGLIFHGPHDNGGDGGAPTFSVNLGAHDGWSVHT